VKLGSLTCGQQKQQLSAVEHRLYDRVQVSHLAMENMEHHVRSWISSQAVAGQSRCAWFSSQRPPVLVLLPKGCTWQSGTGQWP
jgi:hypothetical protein